MNRRMMASAGEAVQAGLLLPGIDFDPEETFQRIKGTKVSLRSSDRYLKKEMRDSELAVAKRFTSPQDRRMLVAAARLALKPRGMEATTRILGNKQGVSLMTAARSRSHFKHLSARYHTTSEFNQVVADYTAALSQKRKRLQVEIGEVSVFEAKRNVEHFVVVNLQGEGAEQLAEEQDGLRLALGVNPEIVSADRERMTPHISLAVTHSQIQSEVYAESMQTEITRLKETKGVDTLAITLGKAVTGFVSAY